MQCKHQAPAGCQGGNRAQPQHKHLNAVRGTMSTNASRGANHRPCSCKSSSSDLEWRVRQLSELVEMQSHSIRDLQERVSMQPQVPPKSLSPFEAQAQGSFGDRRLLGLFDARFHSTASGATPKDYRVLPERIFLVRHAESEGNVDNTAYSQIPDSQVPLTERGKEQARQAGMKIKRYIEQHSPGPSDTQLFFYTSPYKRSLQTYEHIISAFSPDRILGVQEEVQLREQDFGNFQDPQGKQHEKMERLRFGRFFYRFPDGESGADVYDRLTIFEDHLIRDINAGRFAGRMNLVLVTHGLALRIFLMRWFHWSVDEFLQVFNPPNAEPLVLERVPSEQDAKPDGAVSWVHTKALYALSPESLQHLRGCSPRMCSTSHFPRASTAAARNADEAALQKLVGSQAQQPVAPSAVTVPVATANGVVPVPLPLQQPPQQQQQQQVVVGRDGGQEMVCEPPHPPPHHEVAVNCSTAPRQHQEVDVMCETGGPEARDLTPPPEGLPSLPGSGPGSGPGGSPSMGGDGQSNGSSYRGPSGGSGSVSRAGSSSSSSSQEPLVVAASRPLAESMSSTALQPQKQRAAPMPVGRSAGSSSKGGMGVRMAASNISSNGSANAQHLHSHAQPEEHPHQTVNHAQHSSSSLSHTSRSSNKRVPHQPGQH